MKNYFDRIKLVALFCIVGIATSCGDKKTTYPELTLDRAITSVTVQADKKVTVGITSGSGSYAVVSSSPTCATANIVDEAVEITGVKVGTCTVTVSDTKSGQTKSISVEVSDYDDLLLDATGDISIKHGGTKTIEIVSGSGDYSFVIANTAIVSGSQTGNKIVITAVAYGSTSLTITDNKSGKTISMTVKVESSIYFATTITSNMNILIDADLADQAGVWIDLNKNGVKDDGEAVVTFGTSVAYPASQEVTIYGKVTRLTCSAMSIEKLDVSDNPYLRMLNCSNNKIETLDVTKNTELYSLEFGSINNKFTSIDLSNNTKLEILSCSNDSKMTNLNLTKQTSLRELYANGTQIETINFGSINKIEKLDTYMNAKLQLYNLAQFTELYFFRFYSNQLFTDFPDVSKNTKLQEIMAGGIDYSGVTIDFSKNVELRKIYIYNAKLTNASFLSSIPNPEKIEVIDVKMNAITTLDVSRFTNVNYIYCNQNSLSITAIEDFVASLPSRAGLAVGNVQIIVRGMASPPENNDRALFDDEDPITIAIKADARAKNWNLRDEMVIINPNI